MDASPSGANANALLGSMLTPSHRTIGSYADAVVALRSQIKAVRASIALSDGEPLEVAVFGHGGRDTNCCLAVVEAVSNDDALREAVHVSVFSCSWPDDDWEQVMMSFFAHLQASGTAASGSIGFTAVKFSEEPECTQRRIRESLSGKHVVVQCEQGADMFVEPRTGEWLQDNYEDLSVHDACMRHAEATGAPCLLLQTNADLDICRGIDEASLSASVFDGRLQTRAFNLPIEFSKQPTEGAVVPAWGTAGPPQTLVELAIRLGAARDKKLAFRELLGCDPAKEEGQHSRLGFYAAYMAFAAAKTDASLPVAGVQELAIALLRHQPDCLPWSMATGGGTAAAPPPQWVVARFALPAEADGGRVPVLSQYRDADLPTSRTFAEFLARWMAARSSCRVRRNVVPTHCRHAHVWWAQLDLANEIAEGVRAEWPELQLWADGPALLVDALQRLDEALRVNGDLVDDHERIQQKARAVQPDYGAFSPLSRWTAPDLIHVLDFACRMLEAPSGVHTELVRIGSGLTPRPAHVVPSATCRLHAELLSKALLDACHASQHPQGKRPRREG